MSSDSINTTICPLCGADNQCAIANGNAAQSCWCMHTAVSQEALARLPATQRDVACICPRCAAGDSFATVQEFNP